MLPFVIGFDRHRHEFFPVVGPNARPRPAIELGLHDPLAGGQLLGGEEAGTTVAHRQQRLAVHGPFEAKAEQVRVALAKEAVDVDLVADDGVFTRGRQIAMEGDHGVEQPIHGQAARLEIDAEVAGEKQVGLPGFDGDARRNPARVEIPRSRAEYRAP